MDFDSDPTRQQIYLFGGGYSDVWSYDVPSSTWTHHIPGGTVPPARDRAAFAYDSTNNIFLLYGGENASATPLGDTYTYDPVHEVWAKLSPSQSPPPAETFSYLAYDSDDNVFVLATNGNDGYVAGTYNAYGIQTWLFRYAGTGPNVGAATSNPQAASGGLNRNQDSWAKEPSLASDGATLWAGWSETGTPFDTLDSNWPHLYAAQLSGSTWLALGSDAFALDSEAAGHSESHSPSMAVVNGVPWLSWYKTNNAGNLNGSLYAKYWDGNAWVGGAVGVGNPSTSFAIDGRSALAAVGTTPHIAFLETTRDFYPWNTLVYVKTWSGTGWQLKGTGPLNHDATTSGNTADSVSIASDGTNPLVAWTESTQPFGGGNNPLVFVSIWNGTLWQPLGGALNVDAAGGWGFDAAIAYWHGQPYVAWTERSLAGDSKLYVKTWSGSAWSLVGGGALNRSAPGGWAYRPALAASASALEVAWVEQPSLGQKAQTFAAEWNGVGWLALGGSLNADPVGSAERASVSILNAKPVVAWGEVNLGALRQVYVKQWDGNAWVAVSGSINPAPKDTQSPTVPTSLVAKALSTTQIGLTWIVSADNVGVVGYNIYRNGAQVAQATSPSFTDSALSSATSYTYDVAAYDAAGNTSARSSPATATTLGGAAPGSAVTGLVRGRCGCGEIDPTPLGEAGLLLLGMRFFWPRKASRRRQLPRG
jgi:hypothetical protein